MRVLLLTTQIEGRGGIQYVGRLMLKALCDGLGSAGEILVVSVHDRDQKPSENGGWTVLGGGGSSWRAAALAASSLRRGPWDVLILGHLHLAPLLGLGRPGRDWKMGWGWVYGLEAWRPLSRLRRWGIGRLDRLVYISQHSRSAAHQVNPWLARMPDQVCYLGLMNAEVGGQKAEGGGPMADGALGGPLALSIGRLAGGEAYKGHEEMIRAWPQVQQYRPGLRLVIIGDGDDRPRLQSLAERLQANVTFLGGVDDATRDAYLQNCRCFCLPSRGEGFGLVYLEAMREGKPVLAGRLDAGREVVLDGETGRTVDAGDSAELLAGILDVSGPRAEAMGAAGRERFDTCFSFERFTDRFKELLAPSDGR